MGEWRIGGVITHLPLPISHYSSPITHLSTMVLAAVVAHGDAEAGLEDVLGALVVAEARQRTCFRYRQVRRAQQIRQLFQLYLHITIHHFHQQEPRGHILFRQPPQKQFRLHSPHLHRKDKYHQYWKYHLHFFQLF